LYVSGHFDGLARKQQRYGVQPAGVVSPPSLRWAETTAELVPLTPSREKFLYHFKAGPAGGRLRRPSSAGRTRLGTSHHGGAGFRASKSGR
jgi:hypothetical protein